MENKNAEKRFEQLMKLNRHDFQKAIQKLSRDELNELMDIYYLNKRKESKK